MARISHHAFFYLRVPQSRARACGCSQVKRGRKDEEYDDESDEDEEHKTTLREEVYTLLRLHLLRLLHSTRHASQPRLILNNHASRPPTRAQVEREFYPEKYHFWPFGDPFMYKRKYMAQKAAKAQKAAGGGVGGGAGKRPAADDDDGW